MDGPVDVDRGQTTAGDFARVGQSSTGTSWSITTPPFEYANWDAHIVASGTSVYAAYSEGDEPVDGPQGRLEPVDGGPR